MDDAEIADALRTELVDLRDLFRQAPGHMAVLRGLSSDSVASQRMAMSFAIEFHGGLVNGGIEAFRP
jgi:hypothetical protein